MAYDLVIRGGTIIDGTGSPGVQGDVAIQGDRIVALGDDVEEKAARTIDAEGCWVTPGFVDLHTHLDAQIAWDPLGTSSCYHGVTSLVLGNCGVTFAPVRPDRTEMLAKMMESVEDIPAASIMDGVPFTWETYGDYVRWLATEPKGVNVGGYVGHCAVRSYVMGDKAADDDAVPTDPELRQMADLVDEAMAAGALGFSTSRTLRHSVPDGRKVPGTWAHQRELLALAEAVGKHRKGIFGAAPRFDGDGPGTERARSEVELMAAMSKASGRPFTFNVTNTRAEPDLWRETLDFARKANHGGARLRPQTTSRGIGVIFSVAHATPFDNYPGWEALEGATLHDKLAAFADADRRAALVEGVGDGRAAGYEDFFVLLPGRGARYDCKPEDSLTAHAQRRDQSAVDTYIDLALETDGAVILNWPVLNQDFEAIAEMLTDPLVVLGLADAGAHVGQILDASQPTFFLSYWVQERELMPIEEGVRRLTCDTAELAGLRHRGTLKVGHFADVNVIDPDELFLPLPTYEHDFPGGAGRFVQKSKGYRCTLVSGQVFLEDGQHTGALAGELLRPT